ncbi:MAG: inositol monophosphatase [Thermoguttaceae bacterium]|nr:inositol monophosphatase [Thermoguttaceae bacterium]
MLPSEKIAVGMSTSSTKVCLPPQEDLREILRVAVEASQAGGEVLRSFLGRVTAKEKAPADLVTEADVTAQEAIIGVIRSKFPEHQIIAEELPSEAGPGGSPSNAPGSSPVVPPANISADYRWYIDPLDGTTNFFHSFPLFAVSVGVEFRGVLIAGCIFNPLTGDCFHALRGGGAWLGNRLLSTSGCTTFAESLVAIALPSRVALDSPDFRLFVAALNRCQSIRRTGCTALNLAFTAAGWLDAAWGLSCHSWDLAAGVLLVQEAGGAVGDLGRRPFSLASGRFLAAATRELLDEIYHLAEPLNLEPPSPG